LLNAGVYACLLAYVLANVSYALFHGWLRLAAFTLAGMAMAVCLVVIAGTTIWTIWYARATGKGLWALMSPGLKEEFRFGHKGWHRIALVVAAVLCGYTTWLLWAVGGAGAAAVFGSAATIFIFLAIRAHRRRTR
jgi:hypothetical protein